MFSSLPRQFERVAHNALHAAPGEDGLLNGHLFVVPS